MLSLTLPNASINRGAITMVDLRAPDGAAELALAEALIAGVPPVRIVTSLIGACVDDAGSGAPIGAERAAALSIGDREVILRGLYAERYGQMMETGLSCPECGEQVSFTLDLAALTAMPVAASPLAVPTGADVEAASDGAALKALCGGIDEAALHEADPNAECLLGIDCPDCGAHFSAALDGFTLIAQAARAGGGIFGEIDRIAHRYGWSETDIVALPPSRRRIYDAMALA